MTGTFQELNQSIVVVGFSNVKIDNLNVFLEQLKKENEFAIQFFDATKISGSEHLYFAALNAINAFAKKTTISNNLAVESLIYASAQRQIKKALEMLGIKQDSSEIAALIIAPNTKAENEGITLVTKMVSGKRNDNVLELSKDKMAGIRTLFGISNLEFEAKLKKQGMEKEALTDLIIERMALLGTKS